MGSLHCSFLLICCLAALVLATRLPAQAQSGSSALYGVVTQSGAPQPDLQLQLSPETGSALQTRTDAAGQYRFAALPWGNYTLSAESKDGRKQRLTVHLLPSSSLRLDVALSPPAGESTRVRGQSASENVWYGTNFGHLRLDQLPNGRNLWSLLESQEPSTAGNQFNVGGTEPGVPALFSAFGASWTENDYRFNGLDVTDPYQPGLPNINPGIDSLSEFLVVTAAKPAAAKLSGESLELASPGGGHTLHGEAAFYGSGGILQNDNVDARLRRLDFPGPQRLNSLLDGNAQLGGTLPMGEHELPFFAAVSSQQVSQDLGGFAAPIANGVNRVLVDFTPWSTPVQQLDVLYSGQHQFNSAEGAAIDVAPSASTRAKDNFHQFQAHWNRRLNTANVLSASFGVVNAIVSSRLQPGVQSVSTIDLPLGTLTGAAPLATSGTRTRYEGTTIFQTIFNRWGTHSLRAGVDWSRSDITEQWFAFGNIGQVLVNGAASEFIRWNTPAEDRSHVQNVGEFVQDSWRIMKWLTLPIGLRIDSSTGRAMGAANAINWTTLEPRLGFVTPFFVPGLTLVGTWARYGHVLQGQYLDFGNPSALGAELFAQDGTLLRRWGGPYSAISLNLARPYTDEMSFGLEENAKWFTGSIRFIRRDDHRLIGLDNLGVPLSDYTATPYLDPGDDQTLTLYNENPAALGHDSLQLTNLAPHATYKGIEARAMVRLRNVWELSATFTAQTTSAVTATGNSPYVEDTGVVGLLAIDPNTLLMTPGRTYFDHAYMGKITAYYAAPHHFYLAMSGAYFDGSPFGRLLFVNGFNQGPFFVRATPVGHPGGFQTQMNATIDTRLGRDFPLERGTLSAYFDVFNLMNWNSNTQESALTGPMFLQRVPLSVEAPRTMRLGAMWRF